MRKDKITSDQYFNDTKDALLDTSRALVQLLFGSPTPSFVPKPSFYHNIPKEKPEEENGTYRLATEPTSLLPQHSAANGLFVVENLVTVVRLAAVAAIALLLSY
jgi:hypothetical protein